DVRRGAEEGGEPADARRDHERRHAPEPHEPVHAPRDPRRDDAEGPLPREAGAARDVEGRLVAPARQAGLGSRLALFDHVGIAVTDLAASERFYRTVLSVLGAEPSRADGELVEW